MISHTWIDSSKLKPKLYKMIYLKKNKKEEEIYFYNDVCHVTAPSNLIGHKQNSVCGLAKTEFRG